MSSELSSGTSVRIEGVKKFFGDVQAVAGVTLKIQKGELFTLLGPSGCGKTTLLRILAGFQRQTEGSVFFGDTQIDDVPPHKRNTGMVFQNYAIFPHMTVEQNVAYGLKHRRINKAEIRDRLDEALAMTDLTGLGERRPRELSGGQQQRVVLARAIILRPQLLLMDEPLSNLDAKLRVFLREEIRELQQRLGITTVYVTHDQEEALSMSDRIAVMSHGHVRQVGSPREIYRNPASREVAAFVGESNFLEAEAVDGGNNGLQRYRLGDGQTVLAPSAQGRHRVILSIRTHEAAVVPADAPASMQGTTITGRVASLTYLGSSTRYRIQVGGHGENTLTVDVPATRETEFLEAGQSVVVSLAPKSINVLAPENAE